MRVTDDGRQSRIRRQAATRRHCPNNHELHRPSGRLTGGSTRRSFSSTAMAKAEPAPHIAQKRSVCSSGEQSTMSPLTSTARTAKIFSEAKPKRRERKL